MINSEIETYQITEEKHGEGTFFFTDCGNRMYSIKNDPMAYHGKLCPKCFWNGKNVTLYLRGTKEANEYFRSKSASNYCPDFVVKKEEKK